MSRHAGCPLNSTHTLPPRPGIDLFTPCRQGCKLSPAFFFHPKSTQYEFRISLSPCALIAQRPYKAQAQTEPRSPGAQKKKNQIRPPLIARLPGDPFCVPYYSPPVTVPYCLTVCPLPYRHARDTYLVPLYLLYFTSIAHQDLTYLLLFLFILLPSRTSTPVLCVAWSPGLGLSSSGAGPALQITGPGPGSQVSGPQIQNSLSSFLKALPPRVRPR